MTAYQGVSSILTLEELVPSEKVHVPERQNCASRGGAVIGDGHRHVAAFSSIFSVDGRYQPSPWKIFGVRCRN